MELSLYQIDAFANNPFEGNPAAICPLEEWLTDELMQAIANENNLSETAFFVERNNHFHIRWFTPTHEVDLCGHATLASAYVIFNLLGYTKNEILFNSKSGLLKVTRSDDWLVMDFPSHPPAKCDTPQAILNAFADTPLECLCAYDYIVVFEDENNVVNAKPDLSQLALLDLRGVIITSLSSQYDFIARCFAPNYGIDEDPVTGSAFTQLVPYWFIRLGKTHFFAKQVSKRGGEVTGVYAGDRVEISGKAVMYMQATIKI